MKILHVSAFALRGGCEKNCYHFISGSTHHHEVIVLDREGPMSAEWKELGASVKHLNILQYNLLKFVNALVKALRDSTYDYVLCWSTIRLPLQLFACRKITNKIRVHLGNPVDINYTPLKDEMLAVLFPLRDSKVSLIACSSYVAQSHKKHRYFNRFPISMSLNPVLLPDSYPHKENSENKFRIGMVARLDSIKDHRTIIKGFKIVHETLPEAELHLVGDGKMRDELEELVFEIKIKNVVYFHGDVENVYKLLNQWDVFTYATTLSEGLGIAVEEAMANGLPCVLSDLPMLRELAPVDGLVLWFDAGDYASMAYNVLEIYRDKKLRDKLGRASYAHALINFGIGRFVEDYLK